MGFENSGWDDDFKKVNLSWRRNSPTKSYCQIALEESISLLRVFTRHKISILILDYILIYISTYSM